MKAFNGHNFCLETKTAETLYHSYAAKMPIIDYHCHLNPAIIAENKNFNSITELWLAGDHYKWRAMRTNGIDEKYITGDASDWEKFEKWAETVPATIRNPLYHWTHMELKSGFGITELLSPKTAKSIYEQCNAKLQSADFTPRDILKHYHIEAFCTTDDPIDNLEHHISVKKENLDFQMLPTWRPDRAVGIDKEGFLDYISQLESAAETKISSYSTLVQALEKRHDFFAEVGCKLSDHGIEDFFAADYTLEEVENIFKKVLTGQDISAVETEQYKTAILFDLAKMNDAKGWTQQFHYGAIRNNNSRLFDQLGPDTGFDSIGNGASAEKMSRFFNRLDAEKKLAKSIIYNLNPCDNELVATMIGNFQDGSVAGKMQFGSGWWFLDQKSGMENQINALSSLGLLSRFVGMLTDSRSLLSYPRHDYFRRILCNLIGNDVENGLIPNDIHLLGKMVQDISYNNAKAYLDF